MCITLAPSKMSKTIVSCTETIHPETGRLIHVAGYQNKATSLAGPNAMLLPFPSRVAMGPGNVLDTTQTKRLLNDYATAVQYDGSRGMTKGFRSRSMSFDSIQVFEAGSFHVVLANNAADIPSAIRFVPANKRPKVNQALFDKYSELYPDADWQFALCCWDGSVDAEPMLWWYEPKDSSHLFFPALDAHDGLPPKLGARVQVDHTLVVGSTINGMCSPIPVMFRDTIPETLKPYVARHVAGTIIGDTYLQNGDWRFPVKEFGDFDWLNSREPFERVSPLSA